MADYSERPSRGGRSHGGNFGGRRNPGDRNSGRDGDRRFGDDRRGRGEGRSGEGDFRSGGRRSFNKRGDDRNSGARGGRGGRGHGGRFRSNRGGQHSEDRGPRTGPQRSGYREERINQRMNEPELPADVDPKDLDPSVRQELRSLSKDNADATAKHLIMSAVLLDQDPQKALAHARAAKNRAGRVAVARETNGIAAYHAGEWKEAIAELRAARRMTGGPGLLAVLADAERGLGRPEKALAVSQEEGADQLDAESRVELAIVQAGAYHDLNQIDEAVVVLQEQLDTPDTPAVSRMRLNYAYADALERAGRTAEAREFFTAAAKMDTEGLMDSEDRLKALDAENPGNQAHRDD